MCNSVVAYGTKALSRSGRKALWRRKGGAGGGSELFGIKADPMNASADPFSSRTFLRVHVMKKRGRRGPHALRHQLN
jgi:hypothetical protein